MTFINLQGFSISHSYLFIIIYFLCNMLFSYSLDKEGFKRGADKSWLEKKDKLSMYFSGYVYFAVLFYSFFVPIKPGTKIFLFGLILYFLTMVFSLYTSKTFVQEPKDKLIKKGVYQYSRNPIYLTNFLILFTIAFLSGTWIYFIFSGLYLFSSYFTIVVEEKYLMKTYGEEYKNYVKKTPRYLFFK